MLPIKLEKNRGRGAGGKRDTEKHRKLLETTLKVSDKQKMNLIFLHASPMPCLLHYPASAPNRRTLHMVTLLLGSVTEKA